MVSIRFVSNPARHRESIRSILRAVDDAFVPPLTSHHRQDVVRGDEETGGTSIGVYLERCLDRPMVGAFGQTSLIGFASFHAIEQSSHLQGYLPTNHVSIIAVDPERQGSGIGSRIYECLLSDLPSRYTQPHVSTKTWETNHDHIAILDGFGFDCVTRIEDDRGPGIDTVYYARSVQ